MGHLSHKTDTFRRLREFTPDTGVINESVPSTSHPDWISLENGAQLYYFFDSADVSEGFNVDVEVYLKVKTEDGYKVILVGLEQDIKLRGLMLFNLFEDSTTADMHILPIVKTTYTSLPLVLYGIWV